MLTVEYINTVKQSRTQKNEKTKENKYCSHFANAWNSYDQQKGYFKLGNAGVGGDRPLRERTP